MISGRFIAAVKLHPMRNYVITHAAGLHPSTLSKLINGIELVKPGDQRVLRVAEIVGLSPEECFEKEN